MVSIAIMDVRYSLEARGDGCAHGLLPADTAPPWLGTSWHFEDAVLIEEGHDPIKVVIMWITPRVGLRPLLTLIWHSHTFLVPVAIRVFSQGSIAAVLQY